jgi:hypothetical protein
MNRRAFLGLMVGGIAASAAVRTWPFRVYSFPSEIKWEFQSIALQLEKVRHLLPQAFKAEDIWEYDEIGDYVSLASKHLPGTTYVLSRHSWAFQAQPEIFRV